MKTSRNSWLKTAVLTLATFLLMLPLEPVTAQSLAKRRNISLPVEIRAECAPNDTMVHSGDTVRVAINIDTSDLPPPDNRLSAFQAELHWDTSVATFLNFQPAPFPWNVPAVTVGTGSLEWNSFFAGGVDPGKYNLLNLTFVVQGAPGTMTVIALDFVEMISARNNDLLDLITVTNCTITIIGDTPTPPHCTLEIQSPSTGSTVCGDSTDVTAVFMVDGGTTPYADTSCTVNGIAASFSGFLATARIPVLPGSNEIIATCTVTDAQNMQAMCSDTVKVIAPQPLSCSLEIVSPAEGTTVCGDSVKVTAERTVSGGAGAINISCFIDGTPISGTGSTFSATVPLAPSQIFVTASCTFTDECSTQVTCNDTIQIARPAEMSCNVEITSPVDGEVVCGNTIDVTGEFTVTGGAPNPTRACEVNGVVATLSGNTFMATIPLVFGDDFIQATCSATDSCDTQVTCFDTVRVKTEVAVACEVNIFSLADSQVVCADSAKVCATYKASGCPDAPVLVGCTINGIPATVSNDTLCAMIQLLAGNNEIIALCTFAQGSQTATCSDTITVFSSSLSCALAFDSPADSSVLCDSSVTLKGSAAATGGFAPITSVCDINGTTVTLVGGLFETGFNLAPGYNSLVATCTFTDSVNCQAVCRDTIVVFSDVTPPECTFDFSNLPIITGTAFDHESGILSVEVIKINNRVVDIDPFTPGDPVVTFSSNPIDPALRSGFTLRVTNVAGCVIQCDPISLRLAPSDQPCEFTFELPPSDRFVYIQNHGLSRIFLDINEHEIQLVADDAGTGRNGNTYYMPFEGNRTIEITEYLVIGDNQYRLHCEGPAGSFAQLLIVDFYIDDGHGTPTGVDDRDQSPVALPQVFALGANYPNPFNPETHITFEIPAGWQHTVALRVYNAQGQLMATLVNGLVAPGTHTAVWNGRDNSGNHVASGVYFYQIVSKDVVQTRKMTLLQ